MEPWLYGALVMALLVSLCCFWHTNRYVTMARTEADVIQYNRRRTVTHMDMESTAGSIAAGSIVQE